MHNYDVEDDDDAVLIQYGSMLVLQLFGRCFTSDIMDELILANMGLFGDERRGK